MKASVFILAKPGELRRYTSDVEPSTERTAALKAQGYRLIRVVYDLPPEFTQEDHVASGKVDRKADR